MAQKNVLSYEKLGVAKEEELQQAKREREEQKEIYDKFKPYKDLFESKEWKEVVELMKEDAFNNLHHTEDGIWYHRSWGIKMFINCIKERSQAYDHACEVLSK